MSVRPTGIYFLFHSADVYDYELQPPEAAIPPEEDAVSIDAAMVLRVTFAKESPAVRALFDALVDLLTGDGKHRH